MKRFLRGATQSTLLPECVDDFIDESNPVRIRLRRCAEYCRVALWRGRAGGDGTVLLSSFI